MPTKTVATVPHQDGRGGAGEVSPGVKMARALALAVGRQVPIPSSASPDQTAFE